MALVVSYSAYTAEVYRAGMEAVHDSQQAAARALGLTYWQTLRYAILPQAVRNVLPALLNGGPYRLQKDVALLSVIGVSGSGFEPHKIYTARTFNYSSLIVAAILFLLASVPLARLNRSDCAARSGAAPPENKMTSETQNTKNQHPKAYQVFWIKAHPPLGKTSMSNSTKWFASLVPQAQAKSNAPALHQQTLSYRLRPDTARWGRHRRGGDDRQ